MGITIMAGGCRELADNGDLVIEKSCAACVTQGQCEWEPQARELALLAKQWVSVRQWLPPETQAILYLEYPAKARLGTVHYGHYDRLHRRYVEWATGRSLPESAVIAWMSIPPVPHSLYAPYLPAPANENTLPVAEIGHRR